ncbi:MAG TPA: RcpC/CpaB family pilus assembly protein [Chloroflexia bacterium]|nr:RcpC/CpaB family pilus assembly protein [Chloroflexia bacterium]
MSSLSAVFRRKWGLRHVLGLGIILASVTLSFMLVSCGENPTPATSAGNQVNMPANQATVAGPTAAPTTVSNTVLVVVAARPISVGSIITADDLDTVAKPRSEVNPDQDVTQIAEAINRINKVPYNVGQQLKKGDLVEGTFSTYMRQLVADKRLEPGKKAFPYITNDLSTVAGLIQENDLVDVVATYVVERRVPVPSGAQVQANTNPNPGLELTTKTILQNVRVLKVIRLQTRAVETSARATATPNPDTPTAVVAAPATATPTPTLQPFQENGAGFQNNTILVLAVTDQEAEVLKFTREYRFVGTAGRLNPNNPVISTGDTNFFDPVVSGSVAVVHFVLRAKPQDPANPVDPALARETTTGVTFRILVRDYGLPIPELVFATGTQ